MEKLGKRSGWMHAIPKKEMKITGVVVTSKQRVWDAVCVCFPYTTKKISNIWLAILIYGQSGGSTCIIIYCLYMMIVINVI